jgi:hypothetical protein
MRKTDTIPQGLADAPSAATPGARRRPRVGQKVLDAGSTTGLIAYFSTLDIPPSVKGLFLLSAPWLAVIMNTGITLIGILALGLTELYTDKLVNGPVLRLSQHILDNPFSYTDEEKSQAQHDINEIRNNELRIWRSIRSRVHIIFSPDSTHQQ